MKQVVTKIVNSARQSRKADTSWHEMKQLSQYLVVRMKGPSKCNQGSKNYRRLNQRSEVHRRGHGQTQ